MAIDHPYLGPHRFHREVTFDSTRFDPDGVLPIGDPLDLDHPIV